MHGETRDLVAHVKNWKSGYEKKYTARTLRPFVMTPSGETVLACRFLKPIEPPDSVIVSGMTFNNKFKKILSAFVNSLNEYCIFVKILKF